MELEDVSLPSNLQDQSQRQHDLEATQISEHTPMGEDLPRSASCTNLPQTQERLDAAFSFSEDDLVPDTPAWSSSLRKDGLGLSAHNQDWPQSSTHVYSKTSNIPSDSRISVQRTLFVQDQPTQRYQPSQEELQSSRTLFSKVRSREEPGKTISSDTEVAPRAKLSKSLSFVRKARSTRDDSRSPEKAPENSKNGLGSTPTIASAASKAGKFFSRENTFISPKTSETEVKEERSIARSLSRGRSRSARKSAKPQVLGFTEFLSEKNTGNSSELSKRPVTPLPKSFSSNNVPSLPNGMNETTNVPPLLGTMSAEKLNLIKQRSVKKRDELWSAFRALESDYNKFHSKSTSLKANVVRSTLLPFLHHFADHSSNTRLKPEDLDRRTSILNRWWTGLLDLLQGKHGSSVSGSDRPAILDGLEGIMERVEWRYPPSPYTPVSKRTQNFAHSRNESGASTASEEFVLESVHHNVRNVFVQNLFAQMVYIVDKMSLKHAPSSLVSFCGKSCAYAFFFCPGIADILIRLWNIKPSHLQKVLRVANAPSASKQKTSAELVESNFPQCLRQLTFTSIKSTIKQLKQPPVLPLGVEKLKWRGHWLTRWSGRDSELFYAFAQYYHSLLLDFLPLDSSLAQRVSAPGLVIVQAQMLANLESTIHRPSTLDGNGGPNTTVTFEDMLNGESPTAAMPSSPLNAARSMSENRLVLVLRDVLAHSNTSSPGLAQFFVTSFCQVVEAAIRSTSLYDQTACFTLCDFLQEALVILIPLKEDELIQELPLDWSFITEIFKKMVASQNTTTEIRLYSMIFSIWESVLKADVWRDQLCHDFLLERDHFMHTFNHWCPMVRAYYMRLICWRLGRYDGDATDSDTRLLQTLLQRLQEIWAFYSFLDDVAQHKTMLRPSTAPANPAPGRKLLIIRTDTQIPTPLLSFNNMLSSADDSRSSRSKTFEGTNGSVAMTASSILEKVSATLEYGVDVSRRRSSLFRSLWGTRSTETPPRSQSPNGDKISPQSSPPKSKGASKQASPDRDDSRSSMYEQRPSQPTVEIKSKEKKLAATPHKKQYYPQADFRFSLEAVDRRPHNVPGDLELEPPRLPLAAQLLLQSMDFDCDRGPAMIPPRYAAPMRYAGRALAEWTWVVNECQNFFERRRNEGVPSNRQVETPCLGVEPFRRPG